MAAGESGVLGRTVAVDQPGAVQPLQGAGDVRDGKHVAAGEQLPHAAEAVELVIDHLVEQARREPERGDLVFPDEPAQFLQ